MDLEEAPILDAAMRVVMRYGMKRTTMADVAREAGVSRQTLYDRYGDKDGIMAATIALMTNRLCEELRQACAGANDLSAIIDLYYQIVVYPIFEMIEAMPESADLEKGMGPASTEASRAGEAQKEAILTEVFRPHLASGAPSAEDVAMFFMQAGHRAKVSTGSRADLERFLSVLKAATLALSARR